MDRPAARNLGRLKNSDRPAAEKLDRLDTTSVPSDDIVVEEFEFVSCRTTLEL